MSQPTILKLKVSKTGHASITFRNFFTHHHHKQVIVIQAGAELCQAQIHLDLHAELILTVEFLIWA